MKRNRVVFVILWLSSLVGISFYGGPVSYGFFAVLTLLPIFCLLYLLCVMVFFRIYQELDSKNLVAGQRVSFYFTLMNEAFFGFAGIRVRFYSSFSSISGLDDKEEYELWPGTGIQKQTSLVCKYRGEYEVGVKTVEMQDFLRLLRLSYRNREPLRVTVRPALVTLDELRGVDVQDMMARDTVMQQTEPDAVVRRYEHGDDLRHIHWKVSARSGELMSRNRIGQEREGAVILMGTWRCAGDPLTYLPVENKMLETTLALVLFFAQKRIPVQAYHLARTVVQSSISGLWQFDAYYRLLSEIEFSDQYEEGKLMEALFGQRELFCARTACLVLTQWTDEAEGMVRLLAENHVGTMVYLVGDILPERLTGLGIPQVQLRQIPTDADLREVM